MNSIDVIKQACLEQRRMIEQIKVYSMATSQKIMKSNYEFILENEQALTRLKGEMNHMDEGFRKHSSEFKVLIDRQGSRLEDRIEEATKQIDVRLYKIEHYLPLTLEGDVIKGLIEEKVTTSSEELDGKLERMSKGISK